MKTAHYDITKKEFEAQRAAFLAADKIPAGTDVHVADTPVTVIEDHGIGIVTVKFADGSTDSVLREDVVA